MPLGIVQAIPGNSLIPGRYFLCEIFQKCSKDFAQKLFFSHNLCAKSVAC